MNDPVKLVGAFGVAAMPLVGGPFDGETRVGIIGAPVAMRYVPKSAEPKQEPSPLGGWFLIGPSHVEGDDWKKEHEKAADAKRGKQYAVYAPKQHEGKWSLALFFVDIVSFETPGDTPQ